MRKLAVLAVASFLCVAQSAARAEGGCPPGQYPQQGNGWRACVPGPSGAQNQAGQDTRRQIVLDRWQSIALDQKNPILGASAGLPSPANAEHAAMQDCVAKGGTTCKVQIVAVNSCVAMVVGKGQIFINSSGEVDDAIAKGMTECNSDDTGCHTYFTQCSKP